MLSGGSTTMAGEPEVKRAVAFFDGQNLYHHAKAAFGHHHPNYHPIKLFAAICDHRGWLSHGIRFYTGVPESRHNKLWHGYWSNRLLAMRRAGVLVTTRPIRYHRHAIRDEDGTVSDVEVPQEKGIDLRIGLDVVRMARDDQLDVAVIFSQDQDLAEAVRDLKEISRSSGRWIKAVSAFPSGPKATARRGIEGSDWVRIDRRLYDACLDHRDYRPSEFRAKK